MFDCTRDTLHKYLLESVRSPGGEWAGNVPFILATILLFCLFLLLAYRLGRRPPDFHDYDPDEYGAVFNGCRGLLVPITVLLPLLLLLMAFKVRCHALLYTREVWRELCLPGGSLYSEWWPPALCLYACWHAVDLANLVLLNYCWFRRMRFFRQAAMFAMLLFVLEMALKDFVLRQCLPVEHEILSDNIAGLTTGIKIALFVLPYLWFSRRIHATFRH